MNHINSKLILLLIVLCGAFLRMYQLDKESLTMDEVWTAKVDSFSDLYIIKDPANNLPAIVRYWFSQGHFPTYFLFMQCWMKLFGSGEFALRLPSAIFGIMSIYLVFLLGKKLFSEGVGLLASYFFAVSTINIYYSQYARPYNMAAFFVLLSFFSFFRALEKNKGVTWITYIGSTLVALFLSASTLPVIICQIFFVAIFWRKYRAANVLTRAILALGFILLIYLPLLLRLVIPNIRDNRLVPLIFLAKPSFSAITNIFNLFGGKIFIDEMAVALKMNSCRNIFTDIFSIVFFLLCLRGMSGYDKTENKVSVGAIPLFLWLAVPIIFPFIFSYLVTPVFGLVRFVLYISCAYFILIGKGVMSLHKKIRFFLILYIVIFGLLVTRNYYNVEKKTNWREICNYIKENIKEDEKTAFKINNFMPITFVEHMMLSYYSAPFLVGIRNNEDIRKMPKEQGEFYDRAVKSIKWEWHNIEELNAKGIWFPVWNEQEPDLYMIKKLQNKYNLIEEKIFYEVKLYHFKIKE